MQPKPFDIHSVSPSDLLKLVKKEGGQRAFARKHGLPRTSVQERLYKLRKEPFSHRPAPKAKRVGDKRGIRRFILSSAQDGTMPHEQFLSNLEAYRDWLQQHGSCEIMIGPFTYGKGLFEDHATKSKNVNYHDRVKPYLVFDRIRIADKIDFCGEMNTLPTATNPLSGFHTYTNDRWGIFPHAKVQLTSVPRMKHLPPKQIMTTGAVTKPNYILKKAGIKASFHHIYAAVLVEIDADGDFFCRHLIADDTGTFFDLDRKVEEGKITSGHRMTCLTPGDVHVAGIDPVTARAIFGFWPTKEMELDASNRRWERLWESDDENPSMLDVLKPHHLFVHDVLDFRARNHHNIYDPHDRYNLWVTGRESVGNEVREVSLFLHYLSENNPDTQVYVVDSNHDQALSKWLKTADYRTDPVNATFFLRNQLACYDAMDRRDRTFSVFKHAVTSDPNFDCSRVRFLREDKDPIVIGGVEHSNHGHRGPNGARGGVASLSKVGGKMTIGHVHSPAILDGLCASGASCLMDMGYNAGPSGWAATLTGQYENNKRTLITLVGEKWCVPI
jgi:hypothetical protein